MNLYFVIPDNGGGDYATFTVCLYMCVCEQENRMDFYEFIYFTESKTNGTGKINKILSTHVHGERFIGA